MAKNQVLFGMGNQAKLQLIRSFLEPLQVEVLSPVDMHIHADIQENGRRPEENAQIKARSYFAASHLPVFSIDTALSIELLPEQKQPGVYVRRIYGDHATLRTWRSWRPGFNMVEGDRFDSA